MTWKHSKNNRRICSTASKYPNGRRGAKQLLPDEIGSKFYMLTVVGREPNDANGRVMLRVRCGCGNELVVRRTDLVTANTQSCGCLKRIVIRRRIGNMRLKRFGALGALGKSNPADPTERSTEWVTACVLCGQIVFAKAGDLRRGKRRCPCQVETYANWRNMVQRCTNENHPQYKDYGGRGIQICERWRKDFQRFLEDMGKRPEGKSLDRRDPNGPYSPENCCWADAKEQANNRRQTRAEQIDR